MLLQSVSASSGQALSRVLRDRTGFGILGDSDVLSLSQMADEQCRHLEVGQLVCSPERDQQVTGFVRPDLVTGKSGDDVGPLVNPASRVRHVMASGQLRHISADSRHGNADREFRIGRLVFHDLPARNPSVHSMKRCPASADRFDRNFNPLGHHQGHIPSPWAENIGIYYTDLSRSRSIHSPPKPFIASLIGQFGALSIKWSKVQASPKQSSGPKSLGSAWASSSEIGFLTVDNCASMA